MTNTILLTGATGYIGSHTWCALLEAGYVVVGVDNYHNSSPNVLTRIERIAKKKPTFFEGDVRDTAFLRKIFSSQKFDAIIHFAALKAVGESVVKPLDYYDVNIGGLLNLTRVASEQDVKKLIFSSSATVYGDPETVPISETARLTATNPYGRTKLMSEQILRDVEQSDSLWRVGYLRYFNPVGAHPSGLLGESPKGIPNNLFPYVANVAIGNLPALHVYGADYPTQDGTGVRDYIHVEDLAIGHVKAAEHLLADNLSFTVNLGTGNGYSVFEVIQAYEKASDKHIKYQISERRPGDIAACYADANYAKSLLGWEAKKGLHEMCEDSWRWQTLNPHGYE